MSKNIHILTDNKFFSQMIKLINENNLVEQNVILLTYYKGNNTIKYFPPYENILISEKDYDLENISKGFDKIIFHSLKISDIKKIAKFKKQSEVKIYWRQWNTDSFRFIRIAKLFKYGIVENKRLKSSTNRNVLMKLLINFYNSIIITRLKFLVMSDYFSIKQGLQKIDFAGNFYPSENNELKKYYSKYKAEYIYINYVKEFEIDLQQNNEIESLNIVVGQSGYEVSNHKEIIDLLSQMNKQKAIKVHIPLSYGDSDYIKKIISYCEKKSKSEFLPITEFMNQDDYFKLLNTYQVFIYNNSFTYAADNIHKVIRMGKKVYLRDENLHKKYLEESGLVVFSIQDLLANPNEIFIPITEKQIKNNVRKISELFNNNNLVSGLTQVIT